MSGTADSNVTYPGSGIDFDVLWPPLDREFLARLDAKWERLAAERQARERGERLGHE